MVETCVTGVDWENFHWDEGKVAQEREGTIEFWPNSFVCVPQPSRQFLNWAWKKLLCALG